MFNDKNVMWKCFEDNTTWRFIIQSSEAKHNLSTKWKTSSGFHEMLAPFTNKSDFFGIHNDSIRRVDLKSQPCNYHTKCKDWNCCSKLFQIHVHCRDLDTKQIETEKSFFWVKCGFIYTFIPSLRLESSRFLSIIVIIMLFYRSKKWATQGRL